MAIDKYAVGMTASEDQDFSKIKNLDLFQFKIFKNYLGNNVLDVGAGWGRIANLVSKFHSYKNLVLLEPSDFFYTHLENMFKNHPGITMKKCEVDSLQDEYLNYFDSIYSIHVLEHIEDDKKFILNCLDLLKPGGKLIIMVPALQFLYSDLDKNIGHFRRYNKKMLISLIDGLPVKIDRIAYSNFIGVIASLYFIKFRRLEYQSEGKKDKFNRLSAIYDKYIIPLVDMIERVIPMPIGLNLTMILTKK